MDARHVHVQIRKQGALERLGDAPLALVGHFQLAMLLLAFE